MRSRYESSAYMPWPGLLSATPYVAIDPHTRYAMAIGLGTASLLVTVAALYVACLWWQKRSAFNGLPQPPGHSLLLGHAKVIKELIDELPPGLHPAWYGYALREKYNLPRAFYVDLWPFSSPWLVVTSNELAEQVTTKPSLPKFRTLKSILQPFCGRRSLIIMEGDEWKKWRGIFNPAFSPAKLAMHVPAILKETEKFVRCLACKAASGEVFQMEPVAVDLTVEIIGHVILGTNFTISAEGRLYKDALRDQILTVTPGSKAGFGALRKLDPWRRLKMWINERKMSRALGTIIERRRAERRKAGSVGKKALYAIDLALDACAPGDASIDNQHQTLLQDQMKIFIFAGHDTSSGTLCYVLWELHRHVAWLDEARAEHALVLGRDGDAASAAIAARPSLLNELPVTTAIIKETLRLYPAGSTIRGSDVSYPIVDPDTADVFDTRGVMVWVPAFAVMRDARYFPDPHAFRPERWLRNRACPPDLALPQLRDPHAWRPFEVGPRNCIGQELAMMEVKIALALLLTRFDILPAYTRELDPRFDWLGGAAYPVLFGTAKPNEGMPVRVVERKR